MFKTMVVAIDGSHHSEKVIDFAAEYATCFGSRLIILSVDRPARVPDSSHSMIHRELDTQATEVSARAFVEQTVRWGCERAEEAGASTVEGVVRQGYIARTIVDFARQKNADAIVLGSRGMGDLAGFLLGSVSHKVTSLAECTCIVVK